MEIRCNGLSLYSGAVLASASQEAKDRVWDAFDPKQSVDLFNTTYETVIETLDA